KMNKKSTIFHSIKDNLSQIIALTEKNLKLETRFKFNLITAFLTPIITILMPMIIMGQFFQFRDHIGTWDESNFLVFQFIAYNIYLVKAIIVDFPYQLRIEKFWKTLPSIIIAPFNRFNLLLGVLLSFLIIISIPFMILFIICWFYYPISFFSIISIFIIYLLITFIFSGIGLFLGVYAISNENIFRIFNFLINLIFWASCITYPFELFPSIFQALFNLNPLYYIFDILRISWIQNNIIFTISSFPIHFIILILTSVIIPLIGVYNFNKTYNKYGIVGY
ncbi:MAG: ABC transporter permease, partial [Candidatus Lokiarchaeia archaeon]